MLCKPLEVVEAVVLCVLCVLVAMCGVVPVRCAVAVCCSVRCCCCCGIGVVVGTRGGAGNVVGSSLSSRAVVGEVAAARAAATQTDANLEEDEDVVSTNPVVALVAETYLVEEVEEDSVEDPVAKAKAGRCWRPTRSSRR